MGRLLCGSRPRWTVLRAGSGAKQGPDPAGHCKPEVKGREKSRMSHVSGLTNWGDGGIVQWKRNTAEVQAVHSGHTELCGNLQIPRRGCLEGS